MNVSLQKVDAARVNIADRPDPTGRVDASEKKHTFKNIKLASVINIFESGSEENIFKSGVARSRTANYRPRAESLCRSSAKVSHVRVWTASGRLTDWPDDRAARFIPIPFSNLHSRSVFRKTLFFFCCDYTVY